MKQQLLVSIIINNYNYGQYLADAIDSALRQSYPSIEVVAVDDGSTDDSCTIIRSYGDRVTAVFKDNGGQASAFNAGLAQSRGDVVIFLDADDTLLPDTARRVAETFAANPAIAKVQYCMEIIDAHGAPTGTIVPEPHRPMRTGDLRKQVLMFPDDITWTATNSAFAAWVLRQVAPVPERDDKIGADWYLAFVPLLFGPVVSLDYVGTRYRVHGLNSFYLSALDLKRVRQTISMAQYAHVHIKRFADQLGLPGFPHDPNDVLSVAFLGNRMVSLKLDPARHPVEGDNPWRLLARGVAASRRRFDVSFGMKVLYVLWFAAMALAPKSVARWLAELFMFPARRHRLNGLLAGLHRWDGASARVPHEPTRV